MKQREIKFRQLIKDWAGRKLWFYWGFIDGGFVAPQNHQDESYQFTGLLDKNRKEIYEGEIVRFKKQIGWVWWQNHAGYWAIDWSISEESYDTKIKIQHHLELEVVGNIIENKDLLK